MNRWSPLPSPVWRGIPVLVGVILVFVLLFLFLQRAQRRQAYEARATALLDRIEYVEELKLATYYYEEVITIGTRERVAKRVEAAEREAELAEAALIRTELNLARARAAHERALEAFYAVDTLLAGPRQQLDAARAHFAAIDKVFFGAVLEALAQQPDTFGQAVSRAYATWQAQETAVDDTRPGRDRREARRLREAAETDLRQAVEAEKDRRRLNRDRWLEAYHRELDLRDGARRQLAAARDAARAGFEQQQRAYLAAQATLLERRTLLEQAGQELAAAEAAGEALEPRLVVVVPVAVSGFVDMRQLSYQPLGPGQAGDTLLVVLPEPQLDPVDIALEATENYDLAGRLGLSLTEDGFYFEVFQQLQDALGELRPRVREKALAGGLREETQALAEAYVREFAGSLGYQVRFVPVLPTPEAGPAPLVFDTVPAATSESRQ